MNCNFTRKGGPVVNPAIGEVNGLLRRLRIHFRSLTTVGGFFD